MLGGQDKFEKRRKGGQSRESLCLPLPIRRNEFFQYSPQGLTVTALLL